MERHPSPWPILIGVQAFRPHRRVCKIEQRAHPSSLVFDMERREERYRLVWAGRTASVISLLFFTTFIEKLKPKWLHLWEGLLRSMVEEEMRRPRVEYDKRVENSANPPGQPG